MNIIDQYSARPLAAFSRNPVAIAVQAVLLGIALSSPALANDPPGVAEAELIESDNVSVLPATLIQGKSPERELLPAEYAGGQVAYGSRVGLLGNKDFMETPFSTISYTEKFIADTQAQNIADVIAATDPSVFSNGLTGTYSENYLIRGLASSSSDMSFGGLFGIAPYYRTSPEMFERIEVLKGPSALLNGMPPNGSVAGTVNLVPKRAGEMPLTRLTANYMSDAQFGGHLDVGRRFGEEQQFGIRFNQVYRDGDTSVDDQQMKVGVSSLALDWRGERARLSLDLYSAEDRVKGQNRGISLAPNVAVPKPPKSDTLLNPDWAYVETKDKGAIIAGDFDFNEQLQAYAAIGASKTDYAYSGTMSAQVINNAGDYTTTMGQLKMELDKTSGEVGLRGRFQTAGIKHQMTVNATHYGDEQKDFGRRSVPGANWTTNIYNPVWGPAAPEAWPAVQHLENRLASYGAADTLSVLDDRLQLTLGMRRQQVVTDTYSTSTGARSTHYNESATTPAAALLIKLSDDLSVYANYIEGLSKGGVAPITSSNSGEVFEPYKSKQKEVGLKLDLGDFTHTLALYQIERPSSYIDPVTNVYSFGGEQRNRGVEWGFFGSPSSDVRLMGGVAYVEAEVLKSARAANEGKQATGMPKLQGKLGVEWDAPVVEGLTLTANATSVSKQYISADNSLSIPGYTLFDVGARYATQVASRPVTLRGAVTNLTNKAYWGMPLTSSLGLGEPRTVQLSATVDF